MLHAIGQVIRFESRRTLTRGRVVVWILLATLPSILMFLLQTQARDQIPQEPLALMVFYLVPMIGCMLGLLLWATPAVGVELEARTWVYMATRPHGRVAVALGKYVVAVLWTLSAGLVSSVGVAYLSRFHAPATLAGTLCGLTLLACPCYGALYVALGIFVSRRATVIAVVYSLVVEGLISSLPATVNQLTVCYRLRALLAEWIGLENMRSAADQIFGYEPPAEHLFGLLIYTGILLLAATIAIQFKEFPADAEN